MGMFSSWRFRVIGLLLLAIALWQSRAVHSAPAHGAWGELPTAMILFWAAILFVIRRSMRYPWLVALMLVISALLVRVAPGMGVTMIMTFGVCGSRLSWRWLQIIGLPLVVVGAWWLNYPLSTAHLAGFIDSTITLGIVLLLGRFARDTAESRVAQAQALADLQRAHSELQAYAAQVEELSALRERSRVARDLHDTLGHALSAITVQLEAVRRMQRRDPAAVEPMLVETQTLARQAMQELRQYLAGLRAESGGDDLVPALESLAREAASRNHWRLTTHLGSVSLGENARRALLQIAREALTNVERHAGAQAVEVHLVCEGDYVVLTIADDGRGFQTEAHSSGHFGLQGMRERLAELHGELVLQSSPGQGSRLVARLPAAAAIET